MAAAGPRPAGSAWHPPSLEEKVPLQLPLDFEHVGGDAFFQCVVCYEFPMLADIRCCNECGACVCRLCVMKWQHERELSEGLERSSCPQCRTPGWSAAQVFPTSVIKRLASKVDMRCLACKEQFTQSSREAHQCLAKFVCPFEYHDRPVLLTPLTACSHWETYHNWTLVIIETEVLARTFHWDLNAHQSGFIIMYTAPPGYIAVTHDDDNEFRVKCSGRIQVKKVTIDNHQLSFAVTAETMAAGRCKFAVSESMSVAGLSVCVDPE